MTSPTATHERTYPWQKPEGNLDRYQKKPDLTISDLLNFLIQEPEPVYREKAKDFLSSHALADFRKCPLLYRKKKLGLIPDQDRPAYVLGRAVHKLVLEGPEAFEVSYAVGGPINEKTGKPYGSATKAYAEWVAAQGKPALTHEQVALVEAIADGVSQNPIAVGLLENGIPEGVVRTTYQGVECQSRLDWVNPEAGICDLKTADDLTWFEQDARRFGYAYQCSFYQRMFQIASGEKLPFYLIGVEKREPFRAGIWKFDQQLLDEAARENEAAITRLLRCVEKDAWPTGYEESRVFDAI